MVDLKTHSKMSTVQKGLADSTYNVDMPIQQLYCDKLTYKDHTYRIYEAFPDVKLSDIPPFR